MGCDGYSYPAPVYCHVQDDEQACLDTFDHFVEQLRGDLTTRGIADGRVGLQDHRLIVSVLRGRVC